MFFNNTNPPPRKKKERTCMFYRNLLASGVFWRWLYFQHPLSLYTKRLEAKPPNSSVGLITSKQNVTTSDLSFGLCVVLSSPAHRYGCSRRTTHVNYVQIAQSRPSNHGPCAEPFWPIFPGYSNQTWSQTPMLNYIKLPLLLLSQRSLQSEFRLTLMHERQAPLILIF